MKLINHLSHLSLHTQVLSRAQLAHHLMDMGHLVTVVRQSVYALFTIIPLQADNTTGFGMLPQSATVVGCVE